MMTVYKHTLAVAIVAALFSSAVTAETPLYAVLMKSLSNPFWNATESGMKSRAQRAKVDYYLQSVEDDNTTEQQLDACMAMVERKPSIMLTAAINTDNMLPCLQRATDLKVPVVDLGYYMDPTEPDKSDIALSLLPDNQSAGAQAADYIVAMIKTGHVLMLKGESDQSTQLVDGFTTRLSSTDSNLTLIEPAEDQDIFESIKVTMNTTDLKAVFASDDVIAIQAAESLEEAGLHNDIIVVSGSGTSNTFNLVKKGVLHASVITHPFYAGEQAIDEATKILNGNLNEKAKPVPTILISQEFAQQTTDPLLRLIE